MKAYIVATLLISTILLSFVDTSFDSASNSTTERYVDYSPCGPQTFSSNVKSAFQKESNLDQYSASQVYLSNRWVVLLNHPFCNQDLEDLVNLDLVTDIQQFSILSGTWIFTFQTGDIAISYLSEIDEEGYLWNYYPLIEKEVSLKYTPNDSNFSKQWYLDNNGQNNGTSGIDLNIQNVWPDYTGDGVVIGIVDDGIDYNHPDILPNFNSDYSYDVCEDDYDVMPADSLDDEEDIIDWHGTAVSGIAAGKGNNEIGIAGVAYNSSIAGIRLVAGDCNYSVEGQFTLNDLAISQALSYQSENIDIYSNSWGPNDDGKTLAYMGPLTTAVLEAGVSEGRGGLGSIYLWSNGNGLANKDYSNKDAYANSRYTIAVGAINWQGKQTSYSEFGPNILVSAPSHNNSELIDAAVYSTDIVGEEGNSVNNYTSVMGGTSVATPMVAGVVALMLEANPSLTWRDVQHILVQTSKKVDNSHDGWFKTKANRDYNNAYGYGLVDANQAVNLAKTWVNVESEIKDFTDKVEVNQIILDNNNEGVTSSYFMHNSMNIESVEISVNITHGTRGDVNVFLISPSGIVSELVRDNSQDLGDHYHDWTFTSMVHWGENSFGEWEIKVNDTIAAGASDRTFDNWSLSFYGTSEPDFDDDGLPDYVDNLLGTGVTNPDFDADGILDGAEYYGWTDFVGNIHQTNPKAQDTDNDGLTDYEEGFNEIFTTNPNSNDTDQDGLFDGEELNEYFTNPLNVDTDNDTITDYEEIHAYDLYGRYPSDPNSADGDNDTMPDLYELNNGLNPMKKADGFTDADCDGFGASIDSVTGICGPEDKRYTNIEEYFAGTDPNAIDTDGDGLPDGWEYHWGLNPLVDDSLSDYDNDTILNKFEYDNRQIENVIFSLTEPSLKGYWKFDGTDPTSVFNLVTNDINSVLGGAEKVPGKFFNGISCDGVDDNVRMDSLDNSHFTEYTVQSWIKLNNLSGDFSTVVGTVNDGRTWLGINAEGFFEFKVYSGSKYYISPITNDSIQAKFGVWYNLAATYSETNQVLRLYVNGTLVSEENIDNPSIKTATSYNYFCRGQNGEYLNGTIDHISIWNRELTADEINYVFNKPKGFGNGYLYFRIDDGIRFSNPNSTDTDGDGLSDSEEAYFGLDGFITDITDSDTDGDTITDYDEFWVYQTSPVTNDTDGDNYTDNYGFEINLTTGFRLNQTGDAFPTDSLEWNDSDGDGVGDNSDEFPFNKTEQYDSDGDTLGDNYEILLGTDPDKVDTDSDGYNDSIDDFPLDPTEYLDTDEDGVGDNIDACPEDKRDSLDTDKDGVCDKSDPFPNNPNEWKDTDKDGFGDNSDAFPNDASKSLDYEEVGFGEPQIEGKSLDSSMLIIIAFGVVYFVFKKFTK